MHENLKRRFKISLYDVWQETTVIFNFNTNFIFYVKLFLVLK